MKNLLNFFFSFDKLFKEKLIVPFFWLAIIVWGLGFFEDLLEGIRLAPIAWLVGAIQWVVSILFALVLIRLLSELAVALFRINDNLSPDGGKSELADIDPVLEARKAAELAATRTREATRSVSEKASEATKSMRENVGEMSENVQGKAKAATASVREKASMGKSKTEVTSIEEATTSQTSDSSKPAATDKPKATAAKPAAKKTTSKKRGRPAGAKNKSTTRAKRGPKPGTKIARDAEGNLLKKDGTPRKKPGPKK